MNDLICLTAFDSMLLPKSQPAPETEHENESEPGHEHFTLIKFNYIFCWAFEAEVPAVG